MNETPEEGAVAEAVPAEVVETKAGAEEKPEVAATPEGEKQPDKPKKGLTKRFSELTRKIRERDEVIATLQSRLQPQPQAQTVQEPRPEHFADNTEYLRAVAQSEARKVAQSEHWERQRQDSEAKVAHERRALESSFEDREDSLRERFDDYDEVTRQNHDLQISGHMAEAIKASDMGPEIFYHLGKNPEIAQKIAGLSPTVAALAIGRLEAQLSAKPVPQVTSAPPPPKTVGASAKVEKSGDDLSIEEWVARRRKEKYHRRSA